MEDTTIRVIFDGIGLIGVGLIVYAFFLIQRGTVTIQDMQYQWLNLAGAILITISLFNTWNTASFVIEMFWIAISVYGLSKARKNRR